MTERHSIGVVGLGNMGLPIALNLVKEGYPVAGVEIDQDRWEPAEGLTYVADAAAALAKTDTLLLSLPDGKGVQGFLSELLELSLPDTVTVIDTSTIGPKTSQAISQQLAGSSIRYLDSPVSGGVRGAKAGTLAVMCAGSRALYDQVQPALATFTANQLFIGPELGQAQVLKILNNFLSATALAASSEALLFGQAHGLDLTDMCDVINVSTGMNTATLDKIPRQVASGEYNAGFTNSLMYKNISLYLDSCQELGKPGRISQTIVDFWGAFTALSPQSDATNIFRYVDQTL